MIVENDKKHIRKYLIQIDDSYMFKQLTNSMIFFYNDIIIF